MLSAACAPIRFALAGPADCPCLSAPLAQALREHPDRCSPSPSPLSLALKHFSDIKALSSATLAPEALSGCNK
jgi:hypothetical protein